jgi:hypothetical protein
MSQELRGKWCDPWYVIEYRDGAKGVVASGFITGG